MEEDALFVPISALQHYLYCPRQCALIHLEQLWAESRHTAEGRVLHERVDQQHVERRRRVRSVTAMPLVHEVLRITGIADLVEFHRDDGREAERILPVEYKRGRPKNHRADEVQLCAQALCLEAMLKQEIEAGALFYGETRRRVDVPFDSALRDLTAHTIAATHEMLSRRITPSAEYDKRRCDNCSLLDLCQPRLLGRRTSVAAWLDEQLRRDAAP